MKKTIILLFALAFALSFAGCSESGPASSGQATAPILSPEPVVTQQTPSNSEPTEGTAEPVNIHEDENDTLIVYFSLADNADFPDDLDTSTSASIVTDDTGRYGTTEYVANMIQQTIGGDIYPIIVQEPYPADFDAVVDQNHEEAETGYLPPLASNDIVLEQYDTVFVGYPIWATTVPRAIVSFLSENDLSGKTVIPFCTHDGYGSGRSYDEIAGLCPQSTVLEGMAIEARDVPDSEASVTAWLNGLGLEAETAATSESEMPISITIGDTILDGIIYDTPLAQEISENFPLTVTMGGFGGREFYGGLDFTPENAEDGQLNFENGDITYCTRNNTLAIFYAQTDHPDLTMEVVPIGRVTSDLSVFDTLSGSVDMTFAFVE